MSNFDADLSQEQVLASYLDKIYNELKYDFKRTSNSKLQYNGVDLYINYKDKSYIIDEKSQLHYLNKDLPTFTFELSYLNKNGQLKQGWLFDKSKSTHYYFLITGIFLKKGTDLVNADTILKVKITSVNRNKLLNYLESINLSKKVLNAYDTCLRKELQYGKNTIKELNSKNEGLLFFSKNYSEKPMNLQLRLNFLIQKGIAKRIYPIH